MKELQTSLGEILNVIVYNDGTEGELNHLVIFY